MALNEVLNEIRAARTGGETARAPKDEAPAQKAKKKERKMTKAEREAFRARKMKEEEARYLGVTPKVLVRKVKAAPRKERLTQEQVRQMSEIMYANPNPPRAPRQPKILEPLQPLYLLKVPGLPKGDCLAVCLVHGIES